MPAATPPGWRKASSRRRPPNESPQFGRLSRLVGVAIDDPAAGAIAGDVARRILQRGRGIVAVALAPAFGDVGLVELNVGNIVAQAFLGIVGKFSER